MKGKASIRGRCALLCALVLTLVSSVVLTACGGEGEGGPTELTWYIFNEPSGALPKFAKKCSEQSKGEYQIKFEYLPDDADQQREQLVRRLGAQDDSIDIMGMDVIWTGEFANAGWVEQFKGKDEKAATKGVFESVVETARFEDKVYAAPFSGNTQLLWYRKDRVKKPPKTWDEMYRQAEQLGEDNLIEVQGNRYEGLMAWFNAMVESAGTSIVQPDDAQEVNLEPEATAKALSLMGELAESPFADPSLSTSDEESADLAFQAGGASFEINYPFVYPSTKDNAPDVFKNLGIAQYPRVDANKPSAPPLGGINLGVSAYSQHKQEAFDAIRCLRTPANQIELAVAGGLPPITERLYQSKQIDKAYPGFADEVLKAIDNAAPRPVTPAYQDLTLAIQRAIHPLDGIDVDDIGPAVDELRKQVQTALDVEGLL